MRAMQAEVLTGPAVEARVPTACLRIHFPARTARTVPVRQVPLVVRCLTGCIWVTQEGDREDHVLGPGDRFETSVHAELMLFAFEVSDVAVTEAA